MIQFTIPIRTRNPLNGPQGRTRGAVYGKATRRKKERRMGHLCALSSGVVVGGPVAVVTLRRVSSGTLDGDGLQAALKSVRDGIADALGINDGSDAVRWIYMQKKGKRGEYSVEVEIT